MAHTSADVAKLAGVSRSTVSYILNGRADRFAADTVRAVREAVDQLGYRPQPAGRALVRGRTDIVAVLLSRYTGGPALGMLARLAEQFDKAGLTLVVVPAQASDAAFAGMIGNLRPCVVVALGWLTGEQSALLERQGIPTLRMGEMTARPGGLDEGIARLQVDHLLSRGFRRIAYGRLDEAAGDSFLEARQRFVEAHCAQLGLPAPQALTLSLRSEENVGLLRGLPGGTGIACYNDDVAAALIGSAHLAGRKVPAEIGVIGVDNAPISTQTSPQLTTVEPDGGPIYGAVDAVARMAEGQPPPADLFDVEPVLVLRSST